MKVDSELLKYLTPAELAEMDKLLTLGMPRWMPLPGPQTQAYNCTADIVGFGGSAGGGKSDLVIGKALNLHQKCLIARRVGTELTALEDRIEELLGSRDGYNSQKRIWRTKRHDGKPLQIEFASVPNLGDERGYQGRPHDLIVFDEASNFLEEQIRFLLGWLRTTDPKQNCQAIMAFNPPTTADGRWIIDFFAPWIDPKHPNPAQPGEMRWFAVIDGEDVELLTGETVEHNGEMIVPQSRTFIPSRISDNPYLMGTGYMTQLQSLPEPLRSQMLYGDFQAGIGDDPWQIIPTAWVDAAMARWTKPLKLAEMDSMGVDVARGGKDDTVIARRHGMWFDEPILLTGKETPDGPAVAGQVIGANRDQAVIHIDVIGVGSSPYDFLKAHKQQTIGMNGAEGSLASDRSGRLSFRNQRTEMWWKMREALDPANNTGIQLPPDKRLARELCAPKWKLEGYRVALEGRDDIVKRIGFSPDLATAYCMALYETPKAANLPGNSYRQKRDAYNPYDRVSAHKRSGHGYDPYEALKSR